jgi:hypothetical protein
MEIREDFSDSRQGFETLKREPHERSQSATRLRRLWRRKAARRVKETLETALVKQVAGNDRPLDL